MTRSEVLKTTLIGLFGGLLLRVYGLLLRFAKPETRDSRPTWLYNSSAIYVFWHNRQLLLPWFYLRSRGTNRPKVYVLISRHVDGRIIANAIRLFGLGSVAGSSSRGALGATRKMLAHLENGDSVGITPDGPRGPRYQMKTGAISLAESSGKPIIPIACAANRTWVFSSWDRMYFPKPFARVALIAGEPLYLDPKNHEKNVELVKESLSKVTAEADHYDFSNHPPCVTEG